MRQARLKVDDQATWYHCYNRISGTSGDLPFGAVEKEQFVRILKRVSQLYTVEVAGYQVMSNHYHLILYAPVEQPSESEVCRRYKRFYHGRRRLKPGSEKCAQWQARCRDISWFMRHVQQLYTVWYNGSRPVQRRGSLWGSRFKHTLLEDGEALWKCLAYVENNGVRAGLASSAGAYRFGSYGVWRQTGQHPFSKTLKKRVLPMMQDRYGVKNLSALRQMLGETLQDDTTRNRVRHWTDGLVIGSQAYVQRVMRRHRPDQVKRHRLGRLDDPGLCSWRNVRAA
jgi:putative transposase